MRMIINKIYFLYEVLKNDFYALFEIRKNHVYVNTDHFCQEISETLCPRKMPRKKILLLHAKINTRSGLCL